MVLSLFFPALRWRAFSVVVNLKTFPLDLVPTLGLRGVARALSDRCSQCSSTSKGEGGASDNSNKVHRFFLDLFTVTPTPPSTLPPKGWFCKASYPPVG